MSSSGLTGATEGTAKGASTGASVGGGWGAAIGGIVGGLGGYFSGKSAKKAAKQATAVSIWQQLQNQKWQEYMSNTAHQREIQDLKAAGLNPVLAANGGATTPGGGIGNTPAYGSTDWTNAAKGAAEGFEKALALKSLKNATEAKDADVNLKNETKEKTNVEKQNAEIENNILTETKDDIINATKATKAAEIAEAQNRVTNAQYNEENMQNPLFRGIKAFADISNLALGPLANIVQMASTGEKIKAMKQFANKKTPVNTFEEKYDSKGKSLGFKIRRWDR